MEANNPFAMENGGQLLVLSTPETSIAARALLSTRPTLLEDLTTKAHNLVTVKHMDPLVVCLHLTDALTDAISCVISGPESSIPPAIHQQFMSRCNTYELAEKMVMRRIGADPFDGLTPPGCADGPPPPPEMPDPPPDIMPIF